MKRILSVILLLIFSGIVFAQTPATPQAKALTQAEYVKMLYELPKNPGRASDLIELIRTRGIGFDLTDGLRGLTRSKSANNEELKRTLEEAARRRSNPQSAQMPDAKEAAEILAKVREANKAAVEAMPDFVVKQFVNRAAAYAGTNNFRNLDRLIVAASYRTDGFEEYRILSIDGVKQPTVQGGQTYAEAGGATTAGEFASILASIFKEESKTSFQLIDTDVLRGKKSVVFSFEITRENLKRGVAIGNRMDERITTGFKGKIWVDRGNYRIIRIETEATEIPVNFPIQSVKRYIDYEWVTISDIQYLLPSISEVRFVQRVDSRIFETKNTIRFREYQKYGSEVQILEGDEEEVKEDPKP